MRFSGIILAAACIFLSVYSNRVAASGLVKEIDLFKEVGLLTKPFAGVTRTTGFHDKTSAFHFTSSTKHLIANQKAFHEANKLIHDSHDFLLTAHAKIDASSRYAKNTVLSISSRDGQRMYLVLAISGDRRGTNLNIDFSAQVNGGLLKRFTASSPRNTDYKQWHKITVRVQDSDGLLRIFVDDKMAAVHQFNYRFDKFPADAQLRLAQLFEVLLEDTGEIVDRFRGDLQDVKLVLGLSNLNCPEPRPCKCSDVVGTQRCVYEGLRYDDESRWSKDKCTSCQCKKGQVICVHSCPVCKDNSQTYLHGETWNPVNDSCLNCRCEEGKTVCTPPFCPIPDCSGKSGDVITPPGQCCPVCKEDQCHGTGKVYKPCGCKTTCSNYHTNPGQRSCSPCTEGCFCPEGKVLNEHGKCVSSARCSCTHKGKKFKPGQIDFSDPCEFCICLGGRMSCNKMC